MPLPLYKILSRLMSPPNPPIPFPDFPIFPPTNPFKISAEADGFFARAYMQRVWVPCTTVQAQASATRQGSSTANVLSARYPGRFEHPETKQ